MDYRITTLFVLVFALGALCSSLVYEVGKVTSENPSEVLSNPIESVSNTLTAVAQGTGIERDSPGDHVKESQIKVYDSKIELNIKDAIWSRFEDSNSMDPFLDAGSNGIEIKPSSENEIQVGDIISYELNGDIIIHRVINKDTDEKGIYFIAQGDNNPIQDPAKIRFSQIKGILVGIIY